MNYLTVAGARKIGLAMTVGEPPPIRIAHVPAQPTPSALASPPATRGGRGENELIARPVGVCST